MSNDWVKINRTDAVHKAEIIKAVLEEEGDIKTFLINKKDSMHTHLSNGDIEIYVSSKDVIKAKHIISKHKL